MTPKVQYISVLDKHAPVGTKSFPIRLAVPRFDESFRLLHREAQYAKRGWRSRELRALTSGDWASVGMGIVTSVLLTTIPPLKLGGNST